MKYTHIRFRNGVLLCCPGLPQTSLRCSCFSLLSTWYVTCYYIHAILFKQIFCFFFFTCDFSRRSTKIGGNSSASKYSSNSPSS